jgi:hypothetical protein
VSLAIGIGAAIAETAEIVEIAAAVGTGVAGETEVAGEAGAIVVDEANGLGAGRGVDHRPSS